MSQFPPAKADTWPLLAAALLPFALYVFTAGGSAYWLDSPEFTAAAIDLDIPHPPGHPLASLWGKLFTLLPFGPLPFRVALSQAAASAVALACAQRAVARTLQFVGLSHLAAQLAGVGAAWLLGGSYGFWFQSVRAEVYALQAMLVCFALERLSRLAAREASATQVSGPQPILDPRPFYQATLAVGLGLANHHFISVLALPAFAWAFVRLTRAQRLRPVLWGLVCALLGLSLYAYLPLRAARLPPMDLGHPITPDALAWVVSARVYAKKIGAEAVQPLGERLGDLVVILVENLGALTLICALIGGYLLLRARRSWELAYLWLATALVNLVGRAWLNPVRANPDVLGYMLPGFMALVALAAAGLAVPAVLFEDARRRSHGLVAAVCLAAGLFSLAQGPQQASLASFQAPDLFDELRYRNLPRNAVLALLAPQTVFRHFGAEAVERLRPDVAMLPVPFLDYGDAGEQLARKRPELSGVVRSYLAEQRLSLPALESLLAQRLVLVELDPARTLSLLPRLVPAGLFYALRRTPPGLAEQTRAAEQREALYDWLYAALGDEAQELETKRQLLWLHYGDALYFTWHGLRGQALRATERGLALEPRARELGALAQALRTQSGPIDLRPFLPVP